MGVALSGDADLEHELSYQLRGFVIYFGLMNIRREEEDELSGAEADIAQVFFGNGVEGYVFFFIVGDGGLLSVEGDIAELFRACDHDLDVGVVAVAFGVAFFEGFGSVFIDDGEGVVAVDVVSADGQGGQVGIQRKVDGFGKVGIDGFVPKKLGACGGDHTVKLGEKYYFEGVFLKDDGGNGVIGGHIVCIFIEEFRQLSAIDGLDNLKCGERIRVDTLAEAGGAD